MQAITADTVFAYITHDYRPNIYHHRQAVTERSDVAACGALQLAAGWEE